MAGHSHASTWDAPQGDIPSPPWQEVCQEERDTVASQYVPHDISICVSVLLQELTEEAPGLK